MNILIRGKIVENGAYSPTVIMLSIISWMTTNRDVTESDGFVDICNNAAVGSTHDIVYPLDETILALLTGVAHFTDTYIKLSVTAEVEGVVTMCIAEIDSGSVLWFSPDDMSEGAYTPQNSIITSVDNTRGLSLQRANTVHYVEKL